MVPLWLFENERVESRSALLDYNREDLKPVVPKGTSAANAQASATRELIKNLNRQLALALKNMEVQLEGEISMKIVDTLMDIARWRN